MIRVDDGFEAFYDAERDRLVNAMALAAGSQAVGEDPAAEALARALDRWSRVGVMESPGGWTYRVAVNLLRRRLRRQAIEDRSLRRTRPVDEAIVEPDPELWAAVSSLPARARAAVVLRYVAELTEREVAEAMGVAEGTVSAALSQARRRLTAELGRDGEVRTRG